MSIKIPSEYGGLTLDFDPSKYQTKAGAAKALHRAIRKLSAAIGQDPDIETHISTPEESEKRGYGRCWMVGWESGPYEWAVGVSLRIRGPWGYTEPYYSFDLCFCD